MNTKMPEKVRATSLAISPSHLDVTLQDGRMLRIPTNLFPRLNGATPAQLSHWEWIGEGLGIEWPDLDEHLSVEGFLRQTPYFIPSRSNGTKNRPKPLRRAAA
jgi:hypothetical protein